MTEHVWIERENGGFICDICEENVGTVSSAYPTCEDYFGSNRHVFELVDMKKDMWHYKCSNCKVLLGFYPCKQEEFQLTVHGDVGDCDKALLMDFRDTILES
jgi:hypothetical protein